MHVYPWLTDFFDACMTGTSIISIFYPNNWHSRSTLVVEDLYPSENLQYFPLQHPEMKNALNDYVIY